MKIPLTIVCASEDQLLSEEKDQLKVLSQALGGEGPLRFGPVPRKPVDLKECLHNPTHVEKFVLFKLAAEERGLAHQWTNGQMLREIVFCNFQDDVALRLLKRMDARYWNVSVSQLEVLLREGTVLPLSVSLHSRNQKIRSFAYLQASQWGNGDSNLLSTAALAQMIYVLDNMSRPTEPHHLLGLIVDCNDWHASAFLQDLWQTALEVWQGLSGPAKVDMLLLVDAPAWFTKVWSQLQAKAPGKFTKKKVNFVKAAQLKQYLSPGFEAFLPDTMSDGRDQVFFLVHDYLTLRRYLEEQGLDDRRPTQESGTLMASPVPSSPRRRSSSSISIGSRKTSNILPSPSRSYASPRRSSNLLASPRRTPRSMPSIPDLVASSPQKPTRRQIMERLSCGELPESMPTPSRSTNKKNKSAVMKRGSMGSLSFGLLL
jgi:hypothetical protein